MLAERFFHPDGIKIAVLEIRVSCGSKMKALEKGKKCEFHYFIDSVQINQQIKFTDMVGGLKQFWHNTP